MTLEGKGVLVTGGGSGVGRAVALRLAREGCRVAVAGRREQSLRETAAAFEGQPAIGWRAADVADRSSVERLFEWAAKDFGPVDILVLSAGINTPRRAMVEIDPDAWDAVLAVNASGAFYCVHAVLPEMRRRRSGLIVNISSASGKRGTVLGGAAYSASKFAMSALGICAGLEEARHGIRVTNIYPGEIDTPILDLRPVPVTPEHRAGMLKPDDVAEAVVFVARLPQHARVPELVMVPLQQAWA
jgi:NAD(P)-dependent dehydrogenase (short-subunit alcohol dehydrogenase family)